MSKKLLIKIASTLFLIIALFAFFQFISIYKKIYKPNIFTAHNKPVYIYIPTGSSFDTVWNILISHVEIKNKNSFLWLVEKKNYKHKVRAGKYKIKNRTSNNELVDKLRAGWQEPVQVTFNNIRLPYELAKRVGKQLEASQDEILDCFSNKDLMESYGFTKETFPSMFIPNTYEFFWNTSANQFIKRMNDEYHNFWNDDRLQKAKEIGMTPQEVATLASIVDQETQKKDEKKRIAGLYINRLNKKIRLHADPTVKYAIGDFSIKRVLKKHTLIDSPYNTYKYGGLPPGPICFPSIDGMEAVLDYEKHKYLYMCAREDFSGYHNFATNLNDHNRNAEKYRRALNKRRIYK